VLDQAWQSDGSSGNEFLAWTSLVLSAIAWALVVLLAAQGVGAFAFGLVLGGGVFALILLGAAAFLGHVAGDGARELLQQEAPLDPAVLRSARRAQLVVRLSAGGWVVALVAAVVLLDGSG
jgi:hypothetical protein